MAPEGPTRLLLHGTTLRRAETILRNGPDPNYREPGDQLRRYEFSMAPAEGPFPIGTPEHYARRKSTNFPAEGGPAILEVEVPTEITVLGDNGSGAEFLFEFGYGLEELIQAWPSLSKRIRTL
jgi:hypothetical protein